MSLPVVLPSVSLIRSFPPLELSAAFDGRVPG
jgi:hypothetical protein